MGLNAKKVEYKGGDRKKADPLEAGTYAARVVQVIDLGVQEQNAFKGEPKPPAQSMYVTYELSDEFMKDDDGNDIEDKPRWLSEDFALHSLESDLAKSTKRYYAIDPQCEEDGDWTNLIGRPVMITITARPGKGDKKDVIYNNIASASTMRAKEAAKLPDLVNPPKVVDLSDTSTVETFLQLPQWLQDRIKNGLEFEGSAFEKALKNFKKKDSDEEKPAKGKKKAKPEPEDDEDETLFDNDDKTEDEGEGW